MRKSFIRLVVSAAATVFSLPATLGCALLSDLSSTEAHRMVAEGALLVDVRTPEEYAAGHLEGALNIPVQQLSERLSELQPKSRPLVLYCRSGARSMRASSILRDAGYTDVHNLGAMSRWE